MKIVLEENDSFIQSDGIATMVVVAVTKDDGKVVRFPYTAMSKTISDLISDINEKIGNAIPSVIERIENTESSYLKPFESIKSLIKESDGQIKKEDLVKCIKLLPRDKDAPIDMVIGGIYRVLELPKNKIPYYEVIDDTDYHRADTPRRVAAFPEEIAFFAKRKSPIPKEVGRFEQLINCPLCQKRISCVRMDDNKYHGLCEDCQHEIVHENKKVES